MVLASIEQSDVVATIAVAAEDVSQDQVTIHWGYAVGAGVLAGGLLSGRRERRTRKQSATSITNTEMMFGDAMTLVDEDDLDLIASDDRMTVWASEGMATEGLDGTAVCPIDQDVVAVPTCQTGDDGVRLDSSIGRSGAFGSAGYGLSWGDVLRIGVVASLFTLAGFLATGFKAPQSDRITSSTAATVSPSPVPRFKPIREIRLGDRVAGANPLLMASDREERQPDPETWRAMHLIVPSDSGQVDIHLLRPLEWIAHRQASPGANIPLDLPELGVSGLATVIDVTACPEIDHSSGPVVTGTFRHNVSDRLVDVWLRGADEPVTSTVNHPFWCEGTGGFIAAGSLDAGDLLRGIDGNPIEVARVRPKHGTAVVYNLEVHCEHVFQVSPSGVLVHNNSCDTGSGKLPQRLRNKLKRIRNEIAAGGNRSVSGQVSPADANRLGEAFVGRGARLSSDGTALVSADGLRQYRFPQYKQIQIDPISGQPYSQTGYRSNFQSRDTPSGTFLNNVHLDVIP